MEYEGATETAALETIQEKIRRNTEQVLRDAKQRQIFPRTAAIDLATRRVKKAMKTRRWSIL